MTASGRRRSINGDTNKLPFAVGLTDLERRILKNYHFMSDAILGSRELRIQIGHLIFGARVFYGHGLFATISPSERHSGLMLKLSRFRKNDPGIVFDDAGMGDWIGSEKPSLEPSVTIDLPPYTGRRALLSRDPLAVEEGFHVTIKVLLPLLLGIRMCPLCPACNANGSEHPCPN